MTTVSELRKDLRLGIVTVSGVFGRQDLDALVHFYGSDAASKCDHIFIWLPDSDISGVTAEMIPELRSRVGAAVAGHKHSLIIRAAIVCLSNEALPFAEAWVATSHPSDGLYSDARLLPTVEAAAAWLELPPAEAAELDRSIANLTKIATQQNQAA
jgi:hypothetical protein